MAAQKKVSVRLSVEAENVDAVRKKLEELGATVQTVGNDNSPERLRRQFEALEGRLDTTARASRRLAADEAVLKRAVDELGVSRERANALLKAAREAYDPAAVGARKETEALRGLIDALDRTGASERKLAEGQALLDKALAGGVQGVTLSAEQHRRLSAALREQHGVIDQTTGKTRLAAHEVTNLSYQLQDAAVQLAGGQSPLLILMQQGPQATGAVGGVGRALSLLLSPVGLAITGATAFAAGLALIGSRAVSLEAQTRGLAATIRAYGTEAGATAGQLRDMAKAMYEAGADKADANAAAKALAATRGLTAAMAREISGLGGDMAEGLGQTVEETVKQLATLGTEGYPAIEKLQRSIGFLTSEELRAVRAAAEHGEQAKALGIALDALHRRFDGLRDQAMSPAQRAMHDLGVGWNAFMDAVAQSKPVMDAISGLSGAVVRMANAVTSSPQQQVSDLQRDLDDLYRRRDSRDKAKADGKTYVGIFSVWDLFGATDGSDLDRQIADVERRLKDAQGRILKEQPQAKPRVAGTSAGANSYGGKVDERAVQYVDEQADAYERLAKAMTGTAAQRALNRAAMQAETEIRDRKLEGDEAERVRILRRKEALLEIGAAYSDQLTALSLAAQGNVALAAAFGQSEAAALRQKAANDAQAAAASNAAVSVAELTRQNVLNAAASAAADAAKQVAELTRQAEAQEQVAAAVKLGVGAQAEAERQGQVALQTHGLLAAAQAAEEEGAAELAKTLRDLAGAYDKASQRAAAAARRTQGEEALRAARQSLDYAQRELALMGQTEPVRARALRSLQIQQQAQEMAKSATADQIAEWKRLQEQIADTQALTQFATEVRSTAKEIAGSISENLFDRLTDPSKATSAVDFFKTIFKRIAVAALEANIVLPIVMQIVGAVPGLFGVQGPATAAAVASAQAGGSGGMGNLLSLGSKFLPNSWTSSITGGINDWAALNLGIGGVSSSTAAGAAAAAQLSAAGVQGATVYGAVPGLANSAVIATPIGADAAAVGSALTTANTPVAGAAGASAGLMSYLGPAGIGAGLGAALPGLLGIQNKAAGALVGAGSGALAGAAAGTWLFPGVGTVLGALIGGGGGLLGGLFGTQKASVGPNSAASVKTGYGNNFAFNGALADNGGSTSAVTQAAQQAAAIINSTLNTIGATNTQERVLAEFQYFEKDNKWYLNNGSKRQFGSSDEAVQALVSETINAVLEDASTEWAARDNPKTAANIRAALNASVGKPVEQLVSNIVFASQDFSAAFDAIGKAQPDQFGAQLMALATQFAQTRARAADLGVTTDGMAESFEKASQRLFAAAGRALDGTGFVDTTASAFEGWRQAAMALQSAGQSVQPSLDLLAKQLGAIMTSVGDDATAVTKLLEGGAALRAMGEDVAATWAEVRAWQVQQKVLQDYATRNMAAQVALGQVSQQAYDMRQLEIAQAQELAAVTDPVLRQALEYTHSLERQAAQFREAQKAAEALTQSGKSLAEWLQGKLGTSSTGVSATAAYQNSLSTYQSDIAKAAANDNDALARIATSADRLLTAYTGLFGSSGATDFWRRIMGEVAALPAVKAADGYSTIVDAINRLPHAGGGPAAGLTMVNDAGPEIVRLPSGSHVMTHRASVDFLRRGLGGATAVVPGNKEVVEGLKDVTRAVVTMGSKTVDAIVALTRRVAALEAENAELRAEYRRSADRADQFAA